MPPELVALVAVSVLRVASVDLAVGVPSPASDHALPGEMPFSARTSTS